jgi:hypothetical protein
VAGKSFYLDWITAGCTMEIMECTGLVVVLAAVVAFSVFVFEFGVWFGIVLVELDEIGFLSCFFCLGIVDYVVRWFGIFVHRCTELEG